MYTALVGITASVDFPFAVLAFTISSSSPSHIKPPPYSHLHDLSTQEGNPQKQHYGESHYNPTVFYQNAIPDVVPSSSSSSGFEMAGQGSWVDAGNELLLLPSFGNVGQTAWMNRPTAGSGGGAAEGSQQWVGVHDFVAEKREGGGGGGLSLSLSSHSPSDLRVVAQLEQSPQDSKTGYLGRADCWRDDGGAGCCWTAGEWRDDGGAGRRRCLLAGGCCWAAGETAAELEIRRQALVIRRQRGRWTIWGWGLGRRAGCGEMPKWGMGIWD